MLFQLWLKKKYIEAYVSRGDPETKTKWFSDESLEDESECPS